MAALDGGGCNLVQQLFEQRLGLLKPLPDAISASSTSSELREREQVRFKVARGVALDYQAVPAAGMLLGMCFQPQRQPSRRAPQPHQAAPRSATDGTSSAALANGAATAAATSTAGAQVLDGVVPTPPPAAPLWRPRQPQPAHATVWALVQPTPGLGVHTALSAVDAGPTGFGGWHQDGFLDLTPRAGIDYSLARHPGSGVSAEAELHATIPSLLLLPELTVQHRVSGAQASQGLQHSSAVSAPVLRGAAVARLRAAEAAAGPNGTLLTFELEGRPRRAPRGLAGGTKLQADNSTAFYGRKSSGSGGCDRSGHAESVSSDSDDEVERSSTSSCSRSSCRVGSGAGKEQQRSQRQVPGLRLQVAPATVRSLEDASGQWRQAWGPGGLHSVVGYQGRQRRWNLELSSRLGTQLSAAGSLVCEGPPDAAAALAAARVDGVPSSLGSSEAGSSRPLRHLRHLQQQAATYLAASRLRKAGIKLICRLQRPARQQLHLESALGEGGELSHTLRYRLGGSGRADWQQQRARADLALVTQPAQQRWELMFDFFAPH